ncbi:GNAT family N-acetyltransferase [Desulfosporosinus sp. PR]|uniref:GNAT family N-acetyltransferase n=1 Tax=Candidatus Desulfosporosinus nitrosoreducens TaxID=3401928 RepID=UPI0027FAB95A|nr:GNAT family N-acetyltransferase [Desulfosporosinus sp. PR]MDQ7094361.1 GNAT family N-acetyltransferase [Desulfosporosinus sp. PR]
MDITYVEGGEELLKRVAPLWEKLNEHHAGISTFFKDDIAKRTFEQRNEQWIAKAIQGFLRIDLAIEKRSDKAIGYCVAVLHEGYGEIDSLYVNEAFRKMGVGSSLIELALKWLDKKAVIKKKINVAVGNEQAFRFYQKYGFYPRAVILEQQT